MYKITAAILLFLMTLPLWVLPIGLSFAVLFIAGLPGLLGVTAGSAILLWYAIRQRPGWFILCPCVGLAYLAAVQLVAIAVAVVASRDLNTELRAAFMAAAPLVSVAISVWIDRATRRPEGCCEGCGYDLRGNVSGQCPECGRTLDGQRATASPF